jgi:hypothetical protein
MEIMEYVNVSTKNPSWLPKDPKGISSLTNQKVIPSDKCRVETSSDRKVDHLKIVYPKLMVPLKMTTLGFFIPPIFGQAQNGQCVPPQSRTWRTERRK